MPLSNGRPIDRLKRSLQDARGHRAANRYLKNHPLVPSGLKTTASAAEVRNQQLADRRDYRQSLIQRLANAYGARRAKLEERLKETERQIASA